MPPKPEKSEKKLISKVKELTLQTKAFKRYLPERVVEKILLNPGSAKVEGEHRLVTVLFADLSGFTHLSEELSKQGKQGAEEITEIVNKYFTKMLDIVSNYEGTVDKFMGDAILVLFGAPTAHEDDPERAVRAALDMQSAMKAFQKIKTSQGIFSLRMSVGINTGLVVAVNVGSEKRMEYTVMGDNVNLAARLEQTAKSGEILISKSTYDKVEGMFDTQTLEAVKVKGKDKPVQMFKVLRVASHRVQEVQSVARLQFKMVGRDEELTVLKNLSEKAFAGKGQIVSIIGDAGIGKTRLIYEFKNTVEMNINLPTEQAGLPTGQAGWLEGKSLSYGSSMLYWVIIDLLRGFFELEDASQKDVIKKKISSKMYALNSGEKYIPFIYNLFAIREPGSVLGYLDAKVIKQNTFDAVIACFVSGAKEKPIILVLDDFHWVDSASLELLHCLNRRIADVPILIVFSFRKSERDLSGILGQGAQDYYTEIHIGELSKIETESVAKSILDTADIPIDLKKLILENSGGNPLYLEELINSLIENGVLKKVQDDWCLDSKISELKIPDSIEGIVMSRLDRLDEKVKSVAQTASVIGKSFQYQLLKYVSDIKNVDKCLNVLTEKDILYKE